VFRSPEIESACIRTATGRPCNVVLVWLFANRRVRDRVASAPFGKIVSKVQSSASGMSQDEVVVDFMNPQGATASHMRGTLIVTSIKLLKELGQYERYLELASPEQRDTIPYALAASWLPMKQVEQHIETCSQLGLHDRQLGDMGAQVGTELFDSVIGTALRMARGAGLDQGLWVALKQVDRVLPRLYDGGGCTVLKRGPKDALLEIHGVSLSQQRLFRAMHHGFIQGVASALSRKAMVLQARPRLSHPNSLATAISWV
jgi:hypothetical protein